MIAHIVVDGGTGEGRSAVAVVGEGQPSRCGSADSQVRAGIVILGGNVIKVCRSLGGRCHRAAGKDRSVVNAPHRNCYGTLGRAAVSVFHLVEKFIGAIKIGGRRIGERPVIIDADHAVVLGHVLYRQQIAIHIIIVGQYIDIYLTVLGHRGLVGHRHRGIIYRCHGDSHHRRGIAALTVTHCEGEAVAPVEIAIRCINQVWSDTGQAAISRSGGNAERQRIALGVRAGEGNIHRCVLEGVHRLAIGNRSVVHRIYQH